MGWGAGGVLMGSVTSSRQMRFWALSDAKLAGPKIKSPPHPHHHTIQTPSPQWGVGGSREQVTPLTSQVSQIMERKPKDSAAPSARPRERKKAMMAPAVSASC